MKYIDEVEVFSKISSLKPNEITYLINNKFKYALKLKINNYTVYLNFNNRKKAECFIYCNNNYYFSLTDELNVIFEYLYLIVNKSNSSEIYYNVI